ncbi:MAG: DUF2914 domain-containing protein [Thiohalomonadaceae bacterium]
MKKEIVGVLAFCGSLAWSAQALAQAQESAPAQAPAQSQAEVRGEVARAQFTSNVSEREPVDNLTALPADASRIYFFTELRDMEGQTVTHRWERDGQVMAEVPFNVGGARWRVWSSKNLDSGATGEWTVTVVDGAGNERARQSIAPAPQ